MLFHINCVGSHKCACVHSCVCVNTGWEVLEEFQRTMLILQAQQAFCVCTCKSAWMHVRLCARVCVEERDSVCA